MQYLGRQFIFLVWWFAFAGSISLSAQKAKQQMEPASVQLLLKSGALILSHPQLAVRDSANTVFLQTLVQFLETKEGFEHPLDTVKNMLRLSDPKGEVVICTWQMPDAQYVYKRFGVVAALDNRGEVRVTVLEDAAEALGDDAAFKILRSDKWFGALYYKILPVKKDGETLYTLLGYAPGKKLNQKVVEVLSIDFRGKPRFGDKIFRIEAFEDALYKKPPMRLILKYTPHHTASLSWNEKEQMIIMDHLSPPDVSQRGQYQYYGPDFSYDGLVWENDWWELKEQVRFNSGQNIQIRPPAPRDTSTQQN
jgi:hypothetical protein